MVTVIIPCRNEIRTIGTLLDDLGAQEMANLQVVVADGMSEDGTWEALQQRAVAGSDPFILVPVRNPDRTIPHGLNRAVEAAEDGIIIRLDAHGRIGQGYLAAIVAAIGERRDLVVGPRIRMIPGAETRMAHVIAAVLNSPIGSGGTPSRSGVASAKEVGHTVMSCWHRAVWEANGGYDESLLSNEDFAFDWCARLRGSTVLSLPAPEYQLEARSTLLALWRQRWRYGWWKAVVLRRYPKSIHLRQIVPILALLITPLLIIYDPGIFVGLVLVWIVLVWALTLPNFIRAKKKGIFSLFLFAPAIAVVIQFVWSGAVLVGLLGNWPGPAKNNQKPEPSHEAGNQ